jgi:hypothetical protein
MLVRDLLVGHLEQTFERESWHPPVAGAVTGLDAIQALWTPAPERHSIWQIVRHLTLWKLYAIAVLAGKTPDGAAYAAQDWARPAGGDADWHRDLDELRDVSARLRTAALALAENASLPDADPDGGGPASLILSIGAHDAYHAGQIQLLRALQGV